MTSRSLLLVSALLSGAHAFSGPQQGRNVLTTFATLDNAPEKDLLDQPEEQPSQKPQQVVMSEALPFLECPEILRDCTWAGNVGFDPFGLASTRAQLWHYREAEMKHARLAMLVRTVVECYIVEACGSVARKEHSRLICCSHFLLSL
jgi:hypothetical protein